MLDSVVLAISARTRFTGLYRGGLLRKAARVLLMMTFVVALSCQCCWSDREAEEKSSSPTGYFLNLSRSDVPSGEENVWHFFVLSLCTLKTGRVV